MYHSQNRPPYPPPQGPPQGYNQQPHPQSLPYPQQHYMPSPAPPTQAGYPPYGAPNQHQPPFSPDDIRPPPRPDFYQGPPQGFPQGPPPQSSPHGLPQGFPQGQGSFGAPPPPFPQQPQFHVPLPSVPSMGYIRGQQAMGDFRPQADQLRRAMKGFGTDEKALIQILARLNPLEMAAVRSTYTQHIRRDLYKDVKSETSGYFRRGLLAIIDGPLQYDVACVREAVEGIGTKEWLLNDILLSRSNADLNAIKTAYEQTYNRSLQKDVADDLSFKTQSLFSMVLRATRHEESAPLDPQIIEAEAKSLHSATAARIVNNVEEVCGIFARASDNELRAINQAFQIRYNTDLTKHIEKEFSGHMEDALLHMLRTALDPAMYDAEQLEECMKGMGTKDEKLVTRIVRLHWNPKHMDQVKRAYRHRYQKELIDRVKGETSRDYQRLMVALLQ
ncbi:Annexin [Aspergillus sclerotioniger CBS 115572]|uniref:Annexin n=1 Tax=Aspergillus sclerotioniger CBS 115572 TaxID=1450535 RepID=A0A317WXD9_9EURO|nr:Annexin [Aspergillus sclerotioniger CBS 115572]PWY89458.1 Annexin [Aspergillus sclerotioniger CBS 115572]